MGYQQCDAVWGAVWLGPLEAECGVWPGGPAGLTSAVWPHLRRCRGAGTSSLEPSPPWWRPWPAVNRARLGWRRVGWSATAPSAATHRRILVQKTNVARVCRKVHDNPLFFWWGPSRQGWPLDQRPESALRPHDWKVSMHDDDDDHPHRRLAPGRVRDFRCRPADIAVSQLTHFSSRPVDVGAESDARGCFREGLPRGSGGGSPRGSVLHRIPRLAPSPRVTAVVGGPRRGRT